LSSITRVLLALAGPDDWPDNYTGISITRMVRVPLSRSERERGERLGALLRQARGERSIVDVAMQAGISPETLRKIERGRIPTPAFFTVMAVVDALELPLEAVVAEVGITAVTASSVA
jgi:DNA-binding phage protein